MSYARISPYLTLWRVLGHIENGCYVNIGAGDSDIHALNEAFHERGWTGIQLISGNGFTRPPENVQDSVMAQVGAITVHWMRVDLPSDAIPASMNWSGTGVRPWILLVHSPAADTASDAWESALLTQGYRYAGSEGAYRFYARLDCGLEDPYLSLLPWPAPVSDASDATPAELARQLRTLQVKLDQSRTIAQESERRRSELEARLILSEERAARVELAELAAAMEAQQVRLLEQQVQAIYASSSWQVTKPMRWLSRLRRSPRSAASELVRFARSGAIRLAGGLLRRALKVVQANPRLYRLAARLAARYPYFFNRLRSRIATDTPSVGGAPGGAMPHGVPAAAPAVPIAASSPATLLGMRFKTLILDELTRSTDSAYERKS